MSAKDNACRKFQANIFNKSKCQNCFKARDAHLLSDEDFTQAKPIYGGWLLLAPEGTNFDNPLHRSRKWQRRFFLLYEHGLLRYALDDMASTLPQGTINLNQCVDVVDGESRTGQKHSLCICTPEKDHYIRAESKEIIHGWQEALMVFPRTNKQNQKKKRKVETPTPQVHVYTDPPTREVLKEQFHPQINHLEHVLALDSPPSSDATLCPLPSPDRLSSPNSHANVLPSSLSSSQSSLDSEQSPESRVGRAGRGGQGYAALADVPRARRLSHRDAYRSSQKRQELRARTRSPGREEEFSLDSAKGRTDDVSSLAGYRRAKSLDRRATETLMTPDLLNFKKGWMTKLYEDGLWKKHWFVLTDQSLRFYRDSIAEEAADLDGEVDLSTCYDVTEFPVQRNYGFQILSKEGLFTLSAMTSGIRRNWIQAILKNMRPTVAPDVTRSLPEERTRSNVDRVNKREGRSKTFDWSEFRPGQENESGQPSIKRADTSVIISSSPSSTSSVPQEQVRMDVDHARDAQEVDSQSTARRNSDVQVEIEQRWHQVETTPLREEKQVPITGSSNVPSDTTAAKPSPGAASTSVHRAPWQRLSKLNQDLKSELESQRRKQDKANHQVSRLRRSYSEAKDIIGHHEAEIEALEDKLTAAMADIVASEQAVARMRSELKIERVRCQEREEEWVRNETTLRSQLRDSEERLRQVEASLLEKNQELRQLEQKQALQRDQHKEVQRLQERLAEATGRLISMEEAQNMREERERKEQRSLEEKHERERQGLTRRLVESEERRREIEEQLQEAQEQTENTSLDLTQDLSLDHMHDLSLTQDIGVVRDSSFQQCRDPEKFISIIHALETKLLSTEEKLRNLTEKIRDQPGLSVMQEHLSTRSTIEDYTTKTCDKLPKDEPSQKFLNKTFGEQDSEEYERALALVESCTERVREILSNQKETSSDESLICTLAEVEKRLVCATMYLRKGSTLYESCQIFDASDVHLMQEGIMRFARTLTFEAEILEKMGFSLQDLNSDIMLALNSIHKDAENIKKNCNGCVSVVYADVLTRKLMLETMFLAEVDKLETSKLSNSAFSQDVIKNACISAELAYSLQNLPMNFQEKFDELQKDLKQRDMALTDAVSASKRAHIESMTQSDSDHLGDIAPPELVPYMEQIEIEEAQSLAAEIVRRHLAGGMLSHSAESESHLQMSWENLIAELKKQAKALRSLSQEIERICEEGETNSLSGLADAIQMKALMQAQVAYVACRLRAGHTRELSLCQETSRNMAALVQEHAESVAAIQRHYQSCLEKEHLSFTGTISSLQEENDMLRGELSYKLRELQEQRQNLTQQEEAFHRQKDELKSRHLRHKEQILKLEQEFQSKVQELEHANREDLRKLEECYSQTICSLEERSEQVENKDEADACPMEEGDGTDQVTCRESLLRIRELEMQLSSMREELEQKPLDGDLTSLKEKYQRDLDSLKATCERGFAAMEEMHQKVIEDIQRQHQREIRKLLEEKERLLEEETNATIAAIEAMKNAHREELEKSQRSQMSGVSADIQELRRQYEEELQSIHRELEVLSEQYSQKCLENAHLAQALEAERQALGQCQRENQKLHIHNQELNHRLNEEITRMHSCISEDKSTSSLTQGKDIYELEVLLRVKESEIQYLKQEINSLKDELQSALRDKKYASDKYKDIYTELSIVKAKADCDINKLREKLLAATEALGELDAEGSGVTAGYDIMKSKSNPDFLKKEKYKQIRGVRSKVRGQSVSVCLCHKYTLVIH
uniref:PH domain-containing protein n=1 Tax=Sinocyclocheilus rhinocerous TaxID=307959 RepID=A0A673J493_9TELE